MGEGVCPCAWAHGTQVPAHVRGIYSQKHTHTHTHTHINAHTQTCVHTSTQTCTHTDVSHRHTQAQECSSSSVCVCPRRPSLCTGMQRTVGLPLPCLVPFHPQPGYRAMCQKGRDGDTYTQRAQPAPSCSGWGAPSPVQPLRP